ncbi:hypothetical protein [Marinisporobacter balticus]|uniref:Nucleotide-diphospho-sugar transferase n=1 Tax=Marinisporobacter balticus TaxID=2018667 RepID=A0A4R2KYD9_9FIRM|nr:hypothetical protein [Marinisporobacter balticus]TCO79064.1 hypothetical protein EV214_103115 [Marinisporobacter balticus]
MEKFYFSTIVSDKYLYKLIVMYKTLKHHCDDFHLCILCTDQTSYHILSDLQFENATCFCLHQIQDKDLMKAKTNRTRQEYAWTLKPAMLYYVMKNFSDTAYYAHIDADICFFSNPEKIFNENPSASLYLTDHNNSNKFMDTYDLTGRYNTGFVGCKNDLTALEAVKWWRSRCIEWCYKDPDIKAKLFGDQRYVERWPKNFSNVHIVNTKGANVAVWNIDNYQLSYKNEKVYIDHEVLIFYHFSGLSIYSSKEFNLSWFCGLPNTAVNLIYVPYMKLLSETIENTKKLHPNFSNGFTLKGKISNIHYHKI